VVLLSVLLGGCAETPSDVLMGPYVNYVTDSSAKVLWVTATAAPSTFELASGLAADLAPPKQATVTQLVEGRPEVLHEALLSELQAGTTYHYSVMDGKTRIAGSFTAALPANSQQPFKFVVYGDNRSFPKRHAAVVKGMLSERPLAFVVNTGDLVASGTDWPQWQTQFFAPAAELLRSTTLWPVRGNHESDGVFFSHLFDLPNNRFYYSFDYGNVHFVVLDSGMEEGPADPAMLTWLDQDLAASKAEWKLVAYHRPTFDVREHRTTWGQEELLPILEKHGVDMVLNGHSHVYQRFRPIGPAGRKPTIHVTTGGGGAPEYDINPSPILEHTYAGLHYCAFQVKGHELEMTVRTPEGRTVDQLKLVKTAGTFQKEIMARALDTKAAKALAFVQSGFALNFPTLPRAGETATVLIPADQFPAGAKVHFRSDKTCPWTTEDATFDFTYDGPPDADPLTLPKPFELKVQAPAKLDVRSDTIRPPMTMRLDVTYQGQTWSRDDVPIAFGQATRRSLVPAPPAVRVLRVAKPITIDGDLADWKNVPLLPSPSKTATGPQVRAAWAPEGLYVACAVDDPGIDLNLLAPTAGDCLVLLVEGAGQRSLNALKSPSAGRYEIYPRPDLGDGKAGVAVTYGHLRVAPEAVKAAWKRTATGYNLELLIPAEALAPGMMQVGSTLGFQYYVHDGRKSLGQFYGAKSESAVSRAPYLWGALTLVEK
jgi:hypothetical protein